MHRTLPTARRPRPSRIGLSLLLPAIAWALAVSFITPASGAPTSTSEERPAVQPLSAEQEQRRAQQATEMYGSPDMLPMDQRQTLALAMGDSQMSGEGAFDSSLYDPNTDRDGNYCHRASTAVGNFIDLPVDLKKNIACSGAQTFQISSTKQGGVYYYEENQGDQLEVLARNTKIEYIYLFIGANDPEGLNFGPRVSDCVKNRIFLGPVCWRYNTGDAGRAVGVVTQNVTVALNNLKLTMHEAGYLETDYKLILGSYPSPINPNWDISAPYAGGCMIWEADAYFARNKVVPMFADSIKAAAAAADVQFLDMRTVFDGHSPCTPAPWVTGVYNSSGNIFNDNDWRQSLHPNPEGHKAFNACFSQAFKSDAMVQSCQVKAGDYLPTVTAPTSMIEIKNPDTALCLTTFDRKTGNSYRVESQPCLGSVVTSLIYDESDHTVHHPQAYDKCWDVWAANLNPGGEMSTWDCHGGDNQRFIFYDDGTIRPETAQWLCVDAGRWGQDNPIGANTTVQNCESGNSRQQFVVQEPQNNQGRLQFQGTNQCIETLGTQFYNHVPVTSWDCGPEAQIFKINDGSTDSMITEMQGSLCFDGPHYGGAQIKLAPCGWHDYQYRGYGRYQYEPETGYIRSRQDPSLVVTSWGPGATLTLEYEGYGVAQKVFLNQDNMPMPGEGYSDWLPPSLNGS